MILNYFHESFVVKKWQIRNLEIFITFHHQIICQILKKNFENSSQGKQEMIKFLTYQTVFLLNKITFARPSNESKMTPCHDKKWNLNSKNIQCKFSIFFKRWGSVKNETTLMFFFKYSFYLPISMDIYLQSKKHKFYFSYSTFSFLFSLIYTELKKNAIVR